MLRVVLMARPRLMVGCPIRPLHVASTRTLQSARPLEPCRYSNRDEIFANWDALRANPEQWYDNRARKTNPRQPDFVRKDDRSVAIWVDSRDVPENAPDVLAELDMRQQEALQANRGGDRRAGEAALWEALRYNPDEWYDNRARKTNPRAPDFARKDDRNTALWLDSYNAPEWLGDLLAELDARRGAYTSDQPAAAYASQGGDARRAEEWAKWEALRANPYEWFDNRTTKSNERQPDFKRKDDRMVALWLTSHNLPPWIDELLAELDERMERRNSVQRYEQSYQQPQAQGYPEQQQYQEQPYAQQQQYQDQPYAQQQRGAAAPMDRETKKAMELANWESLRDNPEQWFDNRRTKTNPRAPDFKRKDDRNVVLWLTSYSVPDWAGELMDNLDAMQAQRGPPANY